MNQNPVIRWAALVFGFWWVVFFYAGNVLFPMVFEEWRPTMSLPDMRLQLRVLGTSLVLGSISVILGSLFIRQLRMERLSSGRIRGMESSLGALPVDEDWFSRRQLPRKTEAALPGADISDMEVWRKWRQLFVQSHPQHVALADAIMTIYLNKIHLPATHHLQGHGAKSLGVHCLSVAAEMQRSVGGFTYSGIRNSRGKLIAGMRKATGVSIANHPLVFIVGLAHDIGKIPGFHIQEGKVVGCAVEHDLLSARLVGRLEEAWEIPDEDREALLTAIGFYHHPMSFPLDSAGLVSSDLGAALLVHLRQVDIAISQMEEEDSYDKDEVGDQSIYEVFIDVVSEVNRINGTDKQGAVGQKWRELVVLHERELRLAMAEKMGLKGQSDDVLNEKIVQPLLLELRNAGLMATNEDIQTVNFQGGRDNESVWNDAIVIRPGKILPGLSQMLDYNPQGSAILKGNQNKNALLDNDFSKAMGGGAGAKSKQDGTAKTEDDDDDFDMFGSPMPTAGTSEPEQSDSPASGKGKGKSQPAPPSPPKKSEPAIALMDQAVAIATTNKETPASETSTQSELELPTGKTSPEKTPTEGAGPEVVAPVTTAPIKPAPVTTEKKESPKEAAPAPSIKREAPPAAPTRALSPRQGASRLGAVFDELMGLDSSDSTIPEETPIEKAIEPAPSSVPASLKEGVASGKVSLQLRPTGFLIAPFSDSWGADLLSWVQNLPESKEPAPASRWLINDKSILILAPDWENHISEGRAL